MTHLLVHVVEVLVKLVIYHLLLVLSIDRYTQVNKSDNESDRILWDPTIRRKSYRNPGDDPRDGSVVLDPIGSHSKIR